MNELIFDNVVLRYDREKQREVIDFDNSDYHMGDPQREQAELFTAYTEFNLKTGEEGNTHKIYMTPIGHAWFLKGGGGGSSTTVQKADPWEGIQPYLVGGGGKPIYEQVSNPNYNNQSPKSARGPQYINKIVGYTGSKLGTAPEAERIYRERLEGGYQGPVLEGPDQSQYDAAQAQLERANQGGGLLPAAQAQQASVIGGEYLDGSKFLEGYGEPIMEAVNSRFANTGRAGSAYHSRSVADALQRGAAQQYQFERGAQDTAARYSPALDQADYFDIGKASEAGGVLRDLSQEELDAIMANQDYPYMRQQQALNDYSTIINAYTGAGGTSTSQTPSNRNTAAGILGGATAGAGLGSALGLSNPWTAGLAAGGALLGFL